MLKPISDGISLHVRSDFIHKTFVRKSVLQAQGRSQRPGEEGRLHGMHPYSFAADGTCATAVAAARLKRTNRTVTISLPGGDLVIDWRERDDHVLMTGTAEFENEGKFDPALFASVA